MELTGRAIGSLIVRFVCIMGFVWQVTNVSNSFFQYKTTSKVLLNSRETRILPQIQLCFTYSDILQIERLNRLLGTSYVRTNDPMAVKRMQSNLTIAQILRSVPSHNESIASCTFRDPQDGLLMLERQGNNCLSFFLVRRYYIQSYVCYIISFTQKTDSFSGKQVANSLHQPGVLYGVALRPGFSGADLISVTLFFGIFPMISRQYSVLVKRLKDFDSMEPRNNVFVFGYSLNKVKLLPAPFDTMCSLSTTDESANHCMEKCMRPMERLLERSRTRLSLSHL